MLKSILLILLLLLNVFDVEMTRRALALGFTEANPIVDWILNKYGFGGLLLMKLLLISYLMVYVEHIKGVGLWLVSGAVVGYLALGYYHSSFV